MISLDEVLSDWPLWGLSTTSIEPHQVVPMHGGLTNLCYQLILPSGNYIIRISAANTEALGIDRKREKEIHQLVASLQFTSALRYCADDNSYWIRDYIEGEVVSESVLGSADLTDSLLAYMVEQLKALHQVPVKLPVSALNISDIAEFYWQMLAANNPDDELLKMKPLMQVAMREPPSGVFCLCHLDPVLANWLYTAEGLQLLDWEYAGFAHPLWDLAALFQGIKQSLKDIDPETEKTLEDKILTLYGVTDLVAWRRACMQMEYLSSLWYQAQGQLP